MSSKIVIKMVSLYNGEVMSTNTSDPLELELAAETDALRDRMVQGYGERSVMVVDTMTIVNTGNGWVTVFTFLPVL